MPIRARTLLMGMTLLLCPLTGAAEESVVPAAEALERLASEQAVMIDIRQPEEWRETGMVPDAIGISMRQPGGERAFRDALLDAVDGDRDAPIVLICRTGNRSDQVRRAMREWGFTDVSHVAEGMLGSAHGPGWIATGLPVEDCQIC